MQQNTRPSGPVLPAIFFADGHPEQTHRPHQPYHTTRPEAINAKLVHPEGNAGKEVSGHLYRKVRRDRVTSRDGPLCFKSLEML